MGDALRLRTARLLTDYLEYCARRPGTVAQPPSTREAALLRSVAAQVRQRHLLLWSRYRGYRGNRVELVARAAQEILPDRGVPTWGLVVVLVTFTGILLERPPSGHTWELKEWDDSVDRDCQSLVTLLCDWLTGPHRSWLEVEDGWDGFCDAFTPAVVSWSRMLVQVLLSCLMATILTYLWTKLL
ncbi:bcl-2-like protein 10 [Molossus molossus]|uniref:Bcl-2-like protein 10 n=1 Tax=Molossus molossus TaxID=27622 RepID=A0A7J8JS63_MOLMO|nr:bcl-2-like protein 10 [Molossus molossus]KAF6499159.1 BCL2 like 10 [Molossus molossus]